MKRALSKRQTSPVAFAVLHHYLIQRPCQRDLFNAGKPNWKVRFGDEVPLKPETTSFSPWKPACFENSVQPGFGGAVRQLRWGQTMRDVSLSGLKIPFSIKASRFRMLNTRI